MEKVDEGRFMWDRWFEGGGMVEVVDVSVSMVNRAEC